MTTPVFDPIPSGPPSADLSGELLTALDHIILTLIKLDAESKKAVLLHSRGQKEHSG